MDGVLYVRDTECWYTVECRDNSYSKHWQKIASDYGLEYNSAPQSDYYTSKAQGSRQDTKVVKQDIVSVIPEGVTYNVKNSKQIRGTGTDDDFDIDFYDANGKRTKNYDIDVDWELDAYDNIMGKFASKYDRKGNLTVEPKDIQKAWDDAQNYLRTTYPNPGKDYFAIYDGSLWYYNAELDKWGYVQDEAGGKKLKDDFEQALEGTVPDRWSN